MNAGAVRSIRAAMRDRQGELRDVALERMRHAMRRAAAAVERDKREGWA